jgi:hypothetical protein
MIRRKSSFFEVPFRLQSDEWRQTTELLFLEFLRSGKMVIDLEGPSRAN